MDHWVGRNGRVIRPNRQARRHYLAERYLGAGELLDVEHSEALVAEVAADPAVRTRAPWLAARVEVRWSERMGYDGRADRSTGTVTFRRPDHGLFAATSVLVLHELAHLVADHAGHGPAFRRTFDALLGRFGRWHGRPDTGWHAGQSCGARLQLELRFGFVRDAVGAAGELWLPEPLERLAGHSDEATARDRLDTWLHHADLPHPFDTPTWPPVR